MLIISKNDRDDFRTFMMAHHRDAEPMEVVQILKTKKKEELPEILCPWIVRNPRILEVVLKTFGVSVIPKTYKDEYRSDIGLFSWEEAGLYGYIGEKMNSICLKHHYNPQDKYLADLENLVECLQMLKAKNFVSDTKYIRDSAQTGTRIEVEYKDKLNRILEKPRQVFDIIYKEELIKEITVFLHDNLNVSKFQVDQIAERLWEDGHVFWSFLEYAREGKLHSYQNMDMDARRILQKYDATVLEAHNYWLAHEKAKENSQNTYTPINIITRKSAMKAHLAVDNVIRFTKNIFKLRKSHKRFVLYIDETKDFGRPYFYGRQCEFLTLYHEILEEVPKLTSGDENVEYRVAFFKTPGNWIQKEKPYMIIYIDNKPDPSLRVSVWEDSLDMFPGQTLQEKVVNMANKFNKEFNCNYVFKKHERAVKTNRVTDDFYFEIERE